MGRSVLVYAILFALFAVALAGASASLLHGRRPVLLRARSRRD
jgi:hypothetical protein